MARATEVTAQVLGGTRRAGLSARTPADLKSELGLSGEYSVSINGDTSDMDAELENYDHVCFAPAVKGGR